MKGTSKVIIGATLVTVVTLAIVLALVLVLLVELYCTLLLRRRQLRTTSSSSSSPTATATDITTFSPAFDTPPSLPGQPSEQSHCSPLISYYAQGVLQAPRNLLFPSISCKEHTAMAKVRNQDCQCQNVLEIHTQESNTSPQQTGLIRTSPLSTSFANSPQQAREIHVQVGSGNACNDKACAGDGVNLVYISNPIYDNDASRPSRANTPFETPDSSPSRLETGGSSGDEEVTTKPSPSSSTYSSHVTPLTPMKKLPSEACSVSLRDATSLGTSGSDSVSNNGISSSSSGSPCTSPSW